MKAWKCASLFLKDLFHVLSSDRWHNLHIGTLIEMLDSVFRGRSGKCRVDLALKQLLVAVLHVHTI